MTSPSLFRKILVASSMGGLLGIGIGCVINAGGGSDECGSILSHSQEVMNADGSVDCVCDQGYQFEDPNDPNNFDCEPIPPKPGTSNCVEDYHVQIGDQCACASGYQFCNNDPDDLTCCLDNEPTGGTPTGGNDSNDTGTDPTVGDDTVDDTGGGGVCDTSGSPNNGVTPPDDACNEGTIGALFCSNTEAEGPEGSIYYECTETGWVDGAANADATCQFDNFDFAVGCIDNGAEVQLVCGDGPGTDCSGEACDVCADDDQLNYCQSGKLHAISCLVQCQDIGDGTGMTFEHGFCDVDPGNGLPTCQCCDSGDKGCPI